MDKRLFQFTIKSLILFFLFTNPLKAQTPADSLVLPLELGKAKLILPDLTAFTDTIPTQKDSLPKVNMLMEANWENNVFNPYETGFLEYPFKITFKDSVYKSPIKRKKVVTSRYGWRWGRPHHGIDIDLISGDEVKALFDGKVRFVAYHGGHGKTVIIRHPNGLETVYAHLSKQLVKVNDTVVKGQVIGKGGVTGNARGSHLHLEVRYKGQSINPEYLFDFNEGNNILGKEIWVTKKWTNPLRHRSTRKSRLAVYSSKEEAISGIEAEPTVYIIKKGDTLWKIARRHQLSINQLCKLNSIKKTSKLRIGQRIVLN